MEVLNDQNPNQQGEHNYPGGSGSLAMVATTQLTGTISLNYSALGNTWIIDSGATDHICSDLSLFTSF